MSRPSYSPAWWLRNAHLATMWGRFFKRARMPHARLERWETQDDDFLDIWRVDAPRGRPRLLLLHGLEGGARSHYVAGLLAGARDRGWQANLLLFRGCGSEPNRARRFYHSGETTDVDLVVRRLLEEDADAPLVMAGVSLGGNVLLKWLGEQGERAPGTLVGAAAVSVPYDLSRSARAIQRGFSRLYQWNFMRSLRRKALAKLARYPDLVVRARLLAARTLYDFDDVVTAPVHGFANAEDYYARSSSIRFLEHIRRPTLLLSAIDDPFLPSEILEKVADLATRNACLETEFHPYGGHVGFVGGAHPLAPRYYAESRVIDWLAACLAPGERVFPAVRSYIGRDEVPRPAPPTRSRASAREAAPAFTRSIAP
jgi:predicted alpha/beta-fold hydrolase